MSNTQICGRCLPISETMPTLIKYPAGRECRFCTFPFDSYSYSSSHTKYHTLCCVSCARKQLICQVCLNDIEYGVPMHLRNAMKKMIDETPDSALPKNEMMKRFAGLSSKQVKPLNIDKLKQLALTKKWEAQDLPFQSDISKTTDTLFLYNIDSTMTNSLVCSEVLRVLNNNVERDNIDVVINSKLHIGTLSFKRNAGVIMEQLVSKLPKFKVGPVEKSYLVVKNCRIHLTSLLNPELSIANIVVNEDWATAVQKLILRDLKAIGMATVGAVDRKKPTSSSKSKSKTLRRRHKLDL